MSTISVNPSQEIFPKGEIEYKTSWKVDEITPNYTIYLKTIKMYSNGIFVGQISKKTRINLDQQCVLKSL